MHFSGAYKPLGLRSISYSSPSGPEFYHFPRGATWPDRSPRITAENQASQGLKIRHSPLPPHRLAPRIPASPGPLNSGLIHHDPRLPPTAPPPSPGPARLRRPLGTPHPGTALCWGSVGVDCGKPPGPPGVPKSTVKTFRDELYQADLQAALSGGAVTRVGPGTRLSQETT